MRSARIAVGAVTLLAILAMGTTATAQLVNPTRLSWSHPASDYVSTVRYEAGWYLSESAPAPVQVADLGKPDAAACPVTAGVVMCNVALPPRPALGSWVVRVQAVGQTQSGSDAPSGWSAPSSPFSMSLVVPVGVSVKP